MTTDYIGKLEFNVFFFSVTCTIVFVLTVSVVKRMTHNVRIKESFLYLNSGKFDNFHPG